MAAELTTNEHITVSHVAGQVTFAVNLPTTTAYNPAGASHALALDITNIDILTTDQNLAITLPAWRGGVNVDTIEFGVIWGSDTHTVTIDGTDITLEADNHPTVATNLLVRYLAENIGYGWVVMVQYSVSTV